ncbi:hypothetical protein ACM66Z_08035 [Sulfurovum sp. ST-21]|uniref:Phage-Barnase-EndoU-ColicinE5/D-RelE like nuclease 3 domain-containing protein n=1 Tax=Sulfurovum indicum TaxID=2779528 RepID=A0A7M1S4V9_9BACT|nr:hypothetical protein [Sulfurovum indicum]QOR61390.1 hypothetical protein IMZ28_08030 [Sulfurovum indicum]
MGIPTKEEICAFVKHACSSNSNSELYLCTINSSTAQKIKQLIPMILTNYDVIITEEYVGHVRNGHKDDLEYICLIPEIISNFDRVSKSIEPNRRTKRTEIFVVFEKRYSDNTVKLVKLRDMRKKCLSLKTIFRKD